MGSSQSECATRSSSSIDSKSTHRPTLRAQSYRQIIESCPDPVTGRAVGVEDYSHGKRPHGGAHIQKETGYLDRKRSVSARDEAKREGR